MFHKVSTFGILVALNNQPLSFFFLSAKLHLTLCPCFYSDFYESLKKLYCFGTRSIILTFLVLQSHPNTEKTEFVLIKFSEIFFLGCLFV